MRETEDSLMTITPAAKLWADFDPRKEPLEIVTVRKWTEDGSDMHAFYFTGETYEGEKARIYAVYGAPKNTSKKLPAVLHIHGGGQTAFVEWLKFWNRRGYAALTFNWGGEWDNRPRAAVWGERLRHCNHMHCADKISAVKPSPRESSWYHWTLVSRRALTALERQKEVDPKRLGIFGISMGGTIVWPFAGLDRRVKAACAIYGVGWNSYPPSKYEKDPKAVDRDTLTWRKTMAPEAYAPLIKCPTLFLSGTNDFHGKLDRAYDTFAAMNADWRAAFTPRYNHHVAEAEGRNLPLWMETHLKGAPAWPKSPEVKVSIAGDGVPMLTVRPDVSQKIKKVEVLYGIESDDPRNRHWRSAPAKKKGETWVAPLPVMHARKRLFAFAQAYYERGMCLASNFEAVVPAKLGKAKATDEPSLRLGDFTKDLDGFHTSCIGTDPHSFAKGLVRVKGPGGRLGVRSATGAAVVSRKLGDPKWAGPAGAKLAFDVYCAEAVVLKISVKRREFGPGSKLHEVSVSLKPRKCWQKVQLSAARFKQEKGPALKQWAGLDKLEIATEKLPKQRPVFSNFRWITRRRK